MTPITLATLCQAASRSPSSLTEIGGGDGERAVVEELAHGLDRLADVATELGGGVAEDVHARQREAGLSEVGAEAVVEGGAGDAGGTGARLPEGLAEGCMEERSLPTSASDRTMAARAGRGSSRRPRTTALAEVAVEHGRDSSIGDIAGCEVDDLGPASGCENESEDDGEVASALEGIGDDLEELLHLGAERPLGAPGRGLGRSTGSQGLALTTSMLNEELEEGRDAGETGADGYGEGSRPERPMPWAKEKTSREVT